MDHDLGRDLGHELGRDLGRDLDHELNRNLDCELGRVNIEYHFFKASFAISLHLS